MTLNLNCDVAIIGGGTAGCAAAVHLRQRGMSVVVLERDLCGGAASGVNFGGVRQQGRNPLELPLARRSRAIWSSIDRLLGENTEFEATGHLKLARTEADMADLEAYAKTAREHGLDLTLIGANAIRAAYPWLGTRVIGASLCAEDGQANPRVVAPAYARLARKLGADVRERTTVTAARRTERGFEIEAGSLRITAGKIINTAGMGAAKIAALFGEHVPLAAMLPNMVVTEPMPYIARQSMGICGGDIYIRQIARGNVIFGGGRGAGDWADWRSRAKTETTLSALPKLVDIVPGFAVAHVIRTWSGIDGETPDGIPVLGHSVTTPGLIHGFGFSGSGFQLGPGVGEVLAELVSDGTTATPIAAFRVDRFAKPDKSAGAMAADVSRFAG
jgi:sarcosine oxidase, subunit beta